MLNTNYTNQACVFFTRDEGMPGNETLAGCNHCFAIVRYPQGVLYINSVQGGVVHRFKSRNKMFSEYEEGGPESGSILTASRLAEKFPDLSPYIQKTPVLKIHNPSDFPVSQIPTHSNLTNDIADLLFYLYVIKKYRRVINPIHIFDVCITKYAEKEFFYGKPMFCHNFIMQYLGVQVGNILTTEHFKDRLITWNGKTNFNVGEF